MNGIKFIKQPEAVGYWWLAYGSSIYTQFPMYGRPTDEQIKSTKELLGWDWVEARKAQEHG